MCASHRQLRRSTAQVIADACDVFGNDERLQPYRNQKEFADDLQRVLEEDYGVSLMGVQLEEAATNVRQYLKSFL